MHTRTHYPYFLKVFVKFEGSLENFRRKIGAALEETWKRFGGKLEDVLSSSTKVMIDVEGGNNLLYLPLDQLIKKQEEDDD